MTSQHQFKLAFPTCRRRKNMVSCHVPAPNSPNLSKATATNLSSAPEVAAPDQLNLSTVRPASDVPGLFSNTAPDAPRLFNNPPPDEPSSSSVSAQTEPGEFCVSASDLPNLCKITATNQYNVPRVASLAEHSVSTVLAPTLPVVPAPNAPGLINVPASYEPSLTSAPASNSPVVPAAHERVLINVEASHEPSLTNIPASNGPPQDPNTNAPEPLTGDARPIQPSSFRLAPILEIFVADYLLPYNHRREALNLARTCRAHFAMLAPLVYRTWVWYEPDGEDVWERFERWESFMDEFPRIGLVR